MSDPFGGPTPKTKDTRMKRKRKDNPEDFWPVEGIDYPYPEEVQKALDLVEAETTRIKRAECAHRFDNYIPMLNDDGRTIAKVWRCDKCGMKRRGEPVTGGMRTQIYGFPYERTSTALPIVITTGSPDPVRDVGGVLMVNAEGSFASSLAAEIAEDMEEMDRDMREMRREMDRDMWEMARDMERMRPHQEGQLRRSISVTAQELDWERVKARNRARQATRTRFTSVISDPDDMSWIKTTNKR